MWSQCSRVLVCAVVAKLLSGSSVTSRVHVWPPVPSYRAWLTEGLGRGWREGERGGEEGMGRGGRGGGEGEEGRERRRGGRGGDGRERRGWGGGDRRGGGGGGEDGMGRLPWTLEINITTVPTHAPFQLAIPVTVGDIIGSHSLGLVPRLHSPAFYRYCNNGTVR